MSERIKCRNILSGYVMEVIQLGQTYLSVNCGPYRKSGEVYSAEDLDFCKEHLLGTDLGDIVRISPSREIYGFSYDRHPVKNIRVPLDQKCEGGTKQEVEPLCLKTDYSMKTVKQLLSGDGDLRPITLVFDDDRKITCLITEFRVDRSQDTLDKYLYDIRHADDHWFDPATVEDNVVVNWFGTIITFSPIDLGPDKYLEIKDYWYEDE